MKQNEQVPVTGQDQKSKSSPSSPASRQKKTASESAKKEQTPPSPLTSGSPILETPKTSSSENANESGAEPTRKRKPKSLMPVPKPQEKRSDAAIKRLKLKPEIVYAAPRITPMLKQTIKGGLKTALDAMRLGGDDPEINAFLRVYDKVPVADRKSLPWEAVAISAKINLKHLLGAIQFAVQTYCSNKSRFIAISHHPEVMLKRVEYAKLAGGEKDRTALDIMVGAQASPKGPTFIGKQVAVFGGGKNTAKDKDDDDEDDKIIDASSNSNDPFEDLFPTPGDIQDKLIPIRQRLLEG